MGPLAQAALASRGHYAYSSFLPKGLRAAPAGLRRSSRVRVVRVANAKNDRETKDLFSTDELLRASNWIKILQEGAKQAGTSLVTLSNAFSETLSETTKRASSPASSESTTTVRRETMAQSVLVNGSGQESQLQQAKQLALSDTNMMARIRARHGLPCKSCWLQPLRLLVLAF